MKPGHMTILALLLVSGQTCRFESIQRVPALVEAVVQRMAEQLGLDDRTVQCISPDPHALVESPGDA